MKQIFSLILSVVFCGFPVFAQITDVFQNKDIRISTFVLEENIQKSSNAMKLEILQDKNRDKHKDWQNIENQLYDKLVDDIQDELTFYQIHQRALAYLKNFNQWHALQEFYSGNSIQNLNLKSARISLVSVLNGNGIYSIEFDFDQVSVKDYYSANFENGTVFKINNLKSSEQQEVLRNLTLNEFTSLYLLQTRKLDLENISRIRGTMDGTENMPDFNETLDYAEAQIYPFFNGLMIEFPAYSKSSFIFENKSFRVLLKNEELNEVLNFFPELKNIYPENSFSISKENVQKFDHDKNFDVLRFKNPPKELDLLNTFNIDETQNKIFSLHIRNYYLSGDSTKILSGSKKFFFDKNKNVIRIEERNDREDIAREIKYSYNSENQILDKKLIGYGNRLKLYFYDNHILSHIELIEIKDYKSATGKSYIDLTISQRHYIYQDNHRYVLEFNKIDEINRSFNIQKRKIEKGNFCTDSLCFLTGENNQINAVQIFSGSPISILLNENHQTIESYFENDRYQYIFKYNEDDKIQKLTEFTDGKLTYQTVYSYSENIHKPVIIQEINSRNSSKTTLIQEYEIDFWQDETH